MINSTIKRPREMKKKAYLSIWDPIPILNLKSCHLNASEKLRETLTTVAIVVPHSFTGMLQSFGMEIISPYFGKTVKVKVSDNRIIEGDFQVRSIQTLSIQLTQLSFNRHSIKT
jgi:hypothetical protein